MSSPDQSEKILNLTWFSLFLNPVEKDLLPIIGQNNFILRASRLSVRAKRLRVKRPASGYRCFTVYTSNFIDACHTTASVCPIDSDSNTTINSVSACIDSDCIKRFSATSDSGCTIYSIHTTTANWTVTNTACITETITPPITVGFTQFICQSFRALQTSAFLNRPFRNSTVNWGEFQILTNQ